MAEHVVLNASDKQEIARNSNFNKLQGSLEEVIKEADVFIGVSGEAGLVSEAMVQSMNHDAIVFPLSNPNREILPSDALKGGARIVGTGRSDYPPYPFDLPVCMVSKTYLPYGNLLSKL